MDVRRMNVALNGELFEDVYVYIGVCVCVCVTCHVYPLLGV